MDTPDTLNYMIYGYVVIFSVMAISLASLVLRWRSLKRDEVLLDELEKDQDQEK